MFDPDDLRVEQSYCFEDDRRITAEFAPAVHPIDLARIQTLRALFQFARWNSGDAGDAFRLTLIEKRTSRGL